MCLCLRDRLRESFRECLRAYVCMCVVDLLCMSENVGIDFDAVFYISKQSTQYFSLFVFVSFGTIRYMMKLKRKIANYLFNNGFRVYFGEGEEGAINSRRV